MFCDITTGTTECHFLSYVLDFLYYVLKKYLYVHELCMHSLIDWLIGLIQWNHTFGHFLGQESKENTPVATPEPSAFTAVPTLKTCPLF